MDRRKSITLSMISPLIHQLHHPSILFSMENFIISFCIDDTFLLQVQLVETRSLYTGAQFPLLTLLNDGKCKLHGVW
ncbi:unnamed protein product [Rhizophagus irregularis]|nr:unnamed protein product [Rhizophagus irregularis]